MLVSHRKQFIYTKTAKTASTSVESYFEPWCMPEGAWEFHHGREEYVSETGIIGYRGPQAAGKRWFHHMPAAAIRAGIGEERWERYFKFAVIRNPFDKLVSGYFFACRPSGGAEELVSGFRQWVMEGGEIMDRHTYTIGGELCLDFFIRYERLTEDLAVVCDRLEIPFRPEQLPVLKAGFRRREVALPAFYDDRTRRIVERKYAFELDRFDYRFPEA